MGLIRTKNLYLRSNNGFINIQMQQIKVQGLRGCQIQDSMVWIQPNLQNSTDYSVIQSSEAVIQPIDHIIFNLPVVQMKKQPKGRKRKNYKKNIVGHILKKVLKQFLYGDYEDKIIQFCYSEGVQIEACRKFYMHEIELTTGPSHLRRLLISNSLEEYPVRTVFYRFTEWFLEERYLRYLAAGKMEQKKTYLFYKNTVLKGYLEKIKKQAANKHFQIQMNFVDLFLEGK